MLAQGLVADVGAVGQDVQDGVALGGEAHDAGTLHSAEYADAGVQQAHCHFGLLDEVTCLNDFLDGLGGFFNRHVGHLNLAQGWQVEETFVVHGVAVNGTHGAGCRIAVVTATAATATAGTHGHVEAEDLQQFGVVAGYFDEHLVCRLQAHLVLLHDVLCLSVDGVGTLEIDNLLRADAGREAHDGNGHQGEESQFLHSICLIVILISPQKYSLSLKRPKKIARKRPARGCAGLAS